MEPRLTSGKLDLFFRDLLDIAAFEGIDGSLNSPVTQWCLSPKPGACHRGLAAGTRGPISQVQAEPDNHQAGKGRRSAIGGVEVWLCQNA